MVKADRIVKINVKITLEVDYSGGTRFTQKPLSNSRVIFIVLSCYYNDIC